MKKSTKNPLDFIIDKLTNSIENTSTGEIFDTAVVRMTLKNLTEIKKSDWRFEWAKEIKDRNINKLYT